jgi:hypothetical protein
MPQSTGIKWAIQKAHDYIDTTGVCHVWQLVSAVQGSLCRVTCYQVPRQQGWQPRQRGLFRSNCTMDQAGGR